MPGKQEPGRLVAGDGAKAFSSSSTPAGSKVPPRDQAAAGKAKAPSGQKVPDWKK